MVCGGRKTSEARTPIAVSASMAMMNSRPRCPVSAIRCPGSGLTAWDFTLSRPSGKRIVFFTSGAGQSAANGPISAAMTATVTPASTAAARLPSLAMSRLRATTTAGQAVAFIDAAAPKARPASTVRGSRQSSAKPRQSRATIGTSVPPTASSSAMIGDAAASAVQRATSLARATRRASAKAAANTSPNHTRGSVTGLCPVTDHSTPKTVMAGR